MNFVQAACPHIEGMRIEDLLAFIQCFQLDQYLHIPTRNGKSPKYDRAWLLIVRCPHL